MKLQSIISCAAIFPLARLALAENCKFIEINHHGQVSPNCLEKFVVLKTIDNRSRVKVAAAGDIDIGERTDRGGNVVPCPETTQVQEGLPGSPAKAKR